MAFLFMHATARDIERVREWINASCDVAWIIKVGQTGCTCTWQAVDRIDAIGEQHHSIWHKPVRKAARPAARIAAKAFLRPTPR